MAKRNVSFTKAAQAFGQRRASNVDAMFETPPATEAPEAEAAAPAPSAGDGERLLDLRLDLIDPSPWQGRAVFVEDRVEDLAASLRERELLQPIVVRPRGERFELVAGERRVRAARHLGWDTIPARVKEQDDFQAHLAGYEENESREALSAWEKALSAARVQQHARESGRAHQLTDLAEYLRVRNASAVSEMLKVADALPPEIVEEAGIDPAEMLALPHYQLIRVARRPAREERVSELRALVRGAEGKRKVRARTQAQEANERWHRYWNEGHFQINIRRPVAELPVDTAQGYLDQMVTGASVLSARVTDRGEPVPQAWGNEHGALLFLPPAGSADERRRTEIRALIERMTKDYDL